MTSTGVEPSTIEREFNAPGQLVFDAWTKVEHLNNWMFPMSGCTCEFTSADIVDGGTSLHKITMPNGNEMWLFTKYEEVKSPKKLVFLQYLSNENGDIVSNPNMPNWPKDMVATLHFVETESNKTKLTFLWEPRNPTPEEIDAFEAARSEKVLSKGWSSGLDQLEAYLTRL
jgi:uncharacterized protein YndB with AHSA1/START domain